MAEYKVIQDVEAEDKLIGPLTLKQFIFACVSAGFAFVAFLIASKTSALALVPFLPFIIVPGVLAAPFGKDQPTDIWLAAKIRFLITPHKRIWDQSGVKNLVNITAPKRITRQLTKNLNQQEVKSRLKALADIIDTRGWAAKSEDINLLTVPLLETTNESDRLIDVGSAPMDVPDINITAADDILDTQNNLTAQKFDSLIKTSSAKQRQAVVARMRQLTKTLEAQSAVEAHKNTSDQGTRAGSTMFSEQIVVPHQAKAGDGDQTATNTKESNEELLLIKQFEGQHQKAERITEMIAPHHKSIKPLDDVDKNTYSQSVTPLKNPDIVNLANTDFNVATIAGLANRKNPASSGESSG
jgi:hypothetical protein